MPYNCCVPQCASVSNKNRNLMFHKFPQEKKIIKKWLIAIKSDKQPTSHTKICSKHFLPSDYTVTSLGRILEKQIITERSLSALQELINFLKQNVRRRDVFHAAGHDIRVQQIANELERGGTGLRNMLDQGWVIESAAALQYFLMRLRKPLIPSHIQALALDENPGVSPEVVAQDILGLLRQDVSGRHATLIIAVLDLLHCILKHSPSDELTGCNIPITMLPIFFNMQSEHILHWRRVAMVFVELIRLAPTYLNFPVEDDLEDARGIIENFNSNDYDRINHVMLQQRLLEVNVVLRRYLISPGHRGDGHGFEIFRPLQRPRLRQRRSLIY